MGIEVGQRLSGRTYSPRNRLFALGQVTAINALMLFSLLATALPASSADPFIVRGRDLKNSLACDEEHKAISFRHDDHLLLLWIPSLLDPPAANHLLTCQKLRQHILKYFPDDTELQLRSWSLIPQSGDKPIGYVSNEVESFCVERGYCMRDILDYWKLSPEIKKCLPSFSLRRLLAATKLPRRAPNVLPIPEVTISVYPFVSYAQRLMAMRTGPADKIIASTMSIGNTTAYHLYEFFKSFPANVILMSDASTLSTQEQNSTIRRGFQEAGVAFLPMTRELGHNGSFHWKAAVKEGSGYSLLTSMNLSSPFASPFLDLMYEFRNRPVSEELRSRLLGQVQSQCGRLDDLKCLFEASGENLGIDTLVLKACKTARAVPLQTAHSNYFLDTQESDAPAFLEGNIDRAESEIIVMSHKISEKRFVNALRRAQARGVAVSLILSESTQNHLNVEVLSNSFTHLLIVDGTEMPRPHQKLILIDRSTLLFGTANFSTTALLESAELLAFTKDQSAITQVLEIADSYLPGVFVTGQGPPQRHLYLGPLEGIAAPDKTRFQPYVEADLPGFPPNYARVRPELSALLDRCGYRGVLINRSQLRKCLNF